MSVRRDINFLKQLLALDGQRHVVFAGRWAAAYGLVDVERGVLLDNLPAAAVRRMTAVLKDKLGFGKICRKNGRRLVC